MKIVGEIQAKFYRLTVVVDSPPSRFAGQESQWLYITKRHADGRVERQSIGIGMSHLDALLKLLGAASAQYSGARREFRVMSDEFEQRAKS